MRYHTALHVLSGVIWKEFDAKVTGGQMRSDRARMDFSFPGEWTPEVVGEIERLTNEALAEERPVKVYELPREEALGNPDLIRTQVNLVPERVKRIRIVEIEGLDTQADGGTHVANTREVGKHGDHGPQEQGPPEQADGVRARMKTLKIAALALALIFAGCGGDPAGSQNGSQKSVPQASESAKTGSEPTSAAPETTAEKAPRLRTLTIRVSEDRNVEVRVEIADEPDEQATGLMARTALGEDRGMLFVFPSEEDRSFWMRDTLIPLSIAYIDAEGRIVDIQDMKALDDDPPHYVSAKPARYALEVNKGFFDERGVKLGDRVELP